MSINKQHILVIGAGVIGLQTALSLLEQGYDVTVVAKHVPGDESIEYTSPWAGAHWRTHASLADTEQCRWDIETYEAWMQLVQEEQMQKVSIAERSGVAILPSTLNFDSHMPHSRDLWFAPHVHNFRAITPTIQGVASAATFTSISIDVPKYLSYLVRKIQALGGVVLRAALPVEQGLDAALGEAARICASAPGRGGNSTTNGKIDVIVNATGLGARALVPDSAVYPVRGQVVLVRGEAAQITTCQGVDPRGDKYVAYVIPRIGAGTTVLGGCNEVGSWSGEVDGEVTRWILESAKGLCPELLGDGGFEVLGVVVGLRPAREGGARMDIEVRGGGGAPRTVVHAYGHGGAGFQNSVGVAREVVRLVGKAVMSESSDSVRARLQSRMLRMPQV